MNYIIFELTPKYYILNLKFLIQNLILNFILNMQGLNPQKLILQSKFEIQKPNLYQKKLPQPRVYQNDF